MTVTVNTESAVGKSFPRVDAVAKVTGRAVYAGDISLPGMLACKVLTSTRPHARILKIDTSQALALPGVNAIITAKDVPDVRYGFGIKDRTLFARDVVRFIGEPIAAVAAVDEMTALEAVSLIRVDYDDLPTVFEPLKAMQPGAPAVHPDMLNYEGATFALGGNICTVMDAERGDTEAALKQADFVFEDTFRTQPINQGYLEPMASVAEVDPSGRITVWTSTQGPYAVRASLAEVLGMPIGRFRVVPMELGGGFGAKLRLSLEGFVALLALKTGKPVRINSTREEVFTLIGPRLQALMKLRTGVMKDGTMVARDAIAVWDMGASLGPGVQSGISHATGAYHIPNFRLRSYAVYTNKTPAGSYRASGVADMTFAVESHMDILARKLGLDPFAFRTQNALVEGDTSVRGEPLPQHGLQQTLEEVQERLAAEPKHQHEGTGIALCEWRGGSSPSTATLTPNEDGTVSVLTGSVDISGTDTVLAQITAAALGIAMDRVIVVKRDTDLAPYTGPSGGSRIIYSQGKVVQQAAEDLIKKVLASVAERLQVDVSSLSYANGQVSLQDDSAQGYSLAETARLAINSRGGPLSGSAALSTMPYSPVFATHGAVVHVDPSTGKVTLKRFVQAQDVGVAINPMAVVGQLEGGVVQGIGRALTEDYQFEQGHPRNASFTTYMLPLAPDLPPIETVLVEVPTEDGPFGARAVAEPPGFGAPAAIANALEDAIGVRIKDLPITADRVLAALRGQLPEPTLDLSFLEQPKHETEQA